MRPLGSGRSRLSAAVRPSPSAPPESKPVGSRASREAATSKAALRESPVPLAWSSPARRYHGNGAILNFERLLDSVGQPMVGTEVWLVVRMADGTVKRIPMGALPEPGIYRAKRLRCLCGRGVVRLNAIMQSYDTCRSRTARLRPRYSRHSGQATCRVSIGIEYA
jgi:hypothetical protein